VHLEPADNREPLEQAEVLAELDKQDCLEQQEVQVRWVKAVQRDLLGDLVQPGQWAPSVR